VSARYFALLLIFGLGHPSREPLDPAQGVQLHSRIPCDGFGSPEDLLRMRPTFSKAGVEEFVVSRYHTERCEVDIKGKCLHHEKAGWRDIWSSSAAPDGSALVPVESCYKWGAADPSQYVLSGWYNEGTEQKPMWRQARIKQVSEKPEVYEFTDPSGGTARLEVGR
jgi:hypothetical protein